MPFIFRDFTGSCCLPLEKCDVVTLCLPDEWEAKTVDGRAFLKARIISITKVIIDAPVPTCTGTSTKKEPRCKYHLEIDTDQILEDPETEEPFELLDADILEIFPYHCILDKIELIEGPTGPAGPVGADGATGPAGPAGPAGASCCAPYFGDGCDGDFTVLTGEEKYIHDIKFPTDDVYLNNLTIDAGGIFHPWGNWFDPAPVPGDIDNQLYYRIFVNGTLTINGTIDADGDPGLFAFGQTGPGCCRRLRTSGSCSPSFTGGRGGAGNAHLGPGGGNDAGGCGGRGGADGGPFVASGEPSPLLMSSCNGAAQGGGAGGNGGNGGGPGGAGATYTAHTDFTPIKLPFILTAVQAAPGTCGQALPADPIIVGGGSGGGGGGGGLEGFGVGSIGGMGGGGGAGGGSIYIYARNIVIGATGIITARGGDGAAGSDGVCCADASGGGGGGGGGGGLVYLVYESFLNSGTIDVSPGAGGAGGLGIISVVGQNGLPGTAGEAGKIYLVNVSTGEFEHTCA